MVTPAMPVVRAKARAKIRAIFFHGRLLSDELARIGKGHP
jgi:hypothetical protein